jgi:hypothetical protein
MGFSNSSRSYQPKVCIKGEEIKGESDLCFAIRCKNNEGLTPSTSRSVTSLDLSATSPDLSVTSLDLSATSLDLSATSPDLSATSRT